jgi:hypothetical protein
VLEPKGPGYWLAALCVGALWGVAYALAEMLEFHLPSLGPLSGFGWFTLGLTTLALARTALNLNVRHRLRNHRYRRGLG